jgi:LmbE family N-acetylglucosaminyl deacetylase
MSKVEETTLARSFPARYAGRTVLAVGAHPDDVELGIGGTLARLSRAGARVVIAVASVPSHYGTRRKEAEEAAKILGCELRVLMDGGACRRVEDVKHYQLVGMLDDVVRELGPAAVLTHSASEMHSDHVSVHNAVVSTQRLRYFDFFAFNPTMCRPMPVPFYPRAYVDISDTIDVKMRAIAAHESQFGSRGIDLAIFRDSAHVMGRLVGVQYAEGLDVGRLLLN